MAVTTTLEALLRRDRVVVITALVTVIVVCWIYILVGAGMSMSAFELTAMTSTPAGMASGETMDGRMGMAMTPVVWTPGYAVLMLGMWWIMMVAMMLPSAAPMVLLFAVVNRKQRQQGKPYVATGVFASGYVLAWGAFSLVAVGLQWGFERTGLLSAMMASTSVLLGAILLIAAGLYQLTPLKHACLRHCRSPLLSITHHWRPGAWGALRMGLEHGVFCTGCCWFLMGLLFYGGVMNLYWIIGLALFVLLEKTIPAGHWVGRISGALLIAWGGVVLMAAL
jgi:predicted metal-binding membrane protein